MGDEYMWVAIVVAIIVVVVVSSSSSYDFPFYTIHVFFCASKAVYRNELFTGMNTAPASQSMQQCLT